MRTSSTRAAGGPRRVQAMSFSSASAGPWMSASTLPSRRLRTQPAKQQVAASAEKAGNLSGAGKGIKVSAKSDPKHGEMKWIVSENGDIRAWNEKNALEVTLIPTLQSGKANWNCKGYPVNAMPSNCGGRS